MSTLGISCLALAILTLGCRGPTFTFPGGALDGPVATVPTDWASKGDSGMAQLETDPVDPYSVNLLFTVVSGALYINAGDTETRWVQNIAANPDVRLRIEGTLYELRAKRVEDAATIAAFAEAWTSQSSFRRNPSELDQVWIYRLVAR